MANKPLVIIGIIGILAVIANKLLNNKQTESAFIYGNDATVDISSDANGNLYLFINSYVNAKENIAKIKKIDYLTNKVENITVNQDINHSTGVAAVDPDGKNLYFVRDKDGIVDLCKIDLKKGEVTVINTSSAQPAFVNLEKIVVDKKGYLYVTDTENPYVKDAKNNLVRKIDVSTGNVTNLGKNLGINAIPAFNNPRDVAIDNNSNVYVADTGNNLVRKIETDDNVKNLETNPKNEYEYPHNVVVDSHGNIYFTDQREKNKIEILWKIDFKTKSVTNVIDNLKQSNTYFKVPSKIFYNKYLISVVVNRLTIDKDDNIYMFLQCSNSLGLSVLSLRYYIIKIEAKTEKLIVLSTS